MSAWSVLALIISWIIKHRYYCINTFLLSGGKQSKSFSGSSLPSRLLGLDFGYFVYFPTRSCITRLRKQKSTWLGFL